MKKPSLDKKQILRANEFIAGIEHYRAALRIVQKEYSKGRSDRLNDWQRQLLDTAIYLKKRIDEMRLSR